MTATVTEHTSAIRVVNVRWVRVMVEGHTMEQTVPNMPSTFFMA